MKLGQKICPNDILNEFENGFGCLKNMATRGRGIFPNMAIYSTAKAEQTYFAIRGGKVNRVDAASVVEAASVSRISPRNFASVRRGMPLSAT